MAKGKGTGFMDTVRVLTGRDLDDTPRKRGGSKRSGGNASERRTTDNAPRGNASRSSVIAAFEYAQKKDALSKDVSAALKTGEMSDELIMLLQVLADRPAVRDLITTQGDVREPAPAPKPSYKLDFRFVHPDSGDWDNERAEKLLRGGFTLEELETDYNLVLRVVRVVDGEEVGEGDEHDYDIIKDKINKKLNR